ncbi:unnamed protein product [Camellia sinensis]
MLNKAEQKQMSRSLSGNSGDTMNSNRLVIKVDVPDIDSISACADLTLPRGAGLCIDTIHGPVFLIADSWESLDGWLDAIRLVYTIFARGKSDVMAAVDEPVYAAGTGVKPAEIARQGLEEAKRKNMDVVIVDTAGRLQIDKTMMDELKEVKRALNPTEVLLGVDTMTGQEAAEEDNTKQATEQKAPGLCAASMEDYNIVESMEPDPAGFRE